MRSDCQTCWTKSISCAKFYIDSKGARLSRIYVLSVTLYGFCRSDYRLEDFYISVSNSSPADATPDPVTIPPPNPDYPVCAHYSGVFPPALRAAIPCDSSMWGRYVIIQKLTSDALILCEVEVYSRKYLMLEEGPPETSRRGSCSLITSNTNVNQWFYTLRTFCKLSDPFCLH